MWKLAHILALVVCLTIATVHAGDWTPVPMTQPPTPVLTTTSSSSAPALTPAATPVHSTVPKTYGPALTPVSTSSAPLTPAATPYNTAMPTTQGPAWTPASSGFTAVPRTYGPALTPASTGTTSFPRTYGPALTPASTGTTSFPRTYGPALTTVATTTEVDHPWTPVPTASSTGHTWNMCAETTHNRNVRVSFNGTTDKLRYFATLDVAVEIRHQEDVMCALTGKMTLSFHKISITGFSFVGDADCVHEFFHDDVSIRTPRLYGVYGRGFYATVRDPAVTLSLRNSPLDNMKLVSHNCPAFTSAPGGGFTPVATRPALRTYAPWTPVPASPSPSPYNQWSPSSGMHGGDSHHDNDKYGNSGYYGHHQHHGSHHEDDSDKDVNYTLVFVIVAAVLFVALVGALVALCCVVHKKKQNNVTLTKIESFQTPTKKPSSDPTEVVENKGSPVEGVIVDIAPPGFETPVKKHNPFFSADDMTATSTSASPASNKDMEII